MKCIIISLLFLVGACTSSNFDEYQHGKLSEIAVDTRSLDCSTYISAKNTVNILNTKIQYLVVYSVGDKNFHKASNELRKLVGEMKSRYDNEIEPSKAYCKEKTDLILKATTRILKGSRDRQR